MEVRPTKALTVYFADDGLTPNSALPLLLYKHAVDFGSLAVTEAADALDRHIEQYHWYYAWTGNVYRRVHYHSTAHELLVVYRGSAYIRFGGTRFFQSYQVFAGDAVIIPAGMGHGKVEFSKDFKVFGCYPDGQQWDLCWAYYEFRRLATRNIKRVKLPLTDPLYGKRGELMAYWNR